MKDLQLDINGEKVKLNIEGDSHFGKDEVLLLQDDDLSKNTEWHKVGYTIVPFLSKIHFQAVYDGITDIIRGFIEKELGRLVPEFTLEKYHDFCSDNDLHLAVVRHFRNCLPVESFPINYQLVEKLVSETCGVDVTTQHPNPLAFGKFFCIRIVRPQRNTDNNPPHRDVWIDILRNAINIYLPIAGSNELSALPLIPGSHYWNEAEIERSVSGSKVNNISFVVPSVVDSSYSLTMIRPIIQKSEMMIFSPYLIHGGGNNLNTDITRVSIEMRLWRRSQEDKVNDTIEQSTIKDMMGGNSC